MGKNKNENSDKKKKRSIFSLFHKKNRKKGQGIKGLLTALTLR